MWNECMDSSIAQKINLLFQSRRLPEQCDQLSIISANALFGRLEVLQSAIYKLDKYFEKTWCLRHVEIDRLWCDIFAALQPVAQPGDDLNSLVAEIRQYQIIEQEMRLLTPALGQRLLLERYRLKTCDVRLARSILFGASREINEPMYRFAWELFDIGSEIGDDLEDWPDDLATFNGNQFLLEIGLRGTVAALALFNQTIHQLRTRVIELLKHAACFERTSIVLNFTLERLAEVENIIANPNHLIQAVASRYSESALFLAKANNIVAIQNGDFLNMPATTPSTTAAPRN